MSVRARPARLAGFTLIELLVAVLVSAIMLAMAFGAINQALNNREAIEAQQDRLTDMQKTLRLLAQDFAQLAPRPVREPAGDGWQPALRADQRGTELVVLTRGGWANPAGIQRPALQRVAYELEDGTLRRLHWVVLDGTLSDQPVRRDLLTRVSSVAFRFMNNGKQWQDQWPPPVNPGNPEANLRVRPIAVEITVELEDFGRIVRLIEVPG